jgi:DNA adenine methylase
MERTVRDMQSEGILKKHVAKPFLKWAGGKGQLLEKFRQLYPKQLIENKIKSFHEPFLGSAAVFFDVAQNYKIEKAYLYDINEELILTYQVIQKDVLKLLELLDQYQQNYSKLDKLKQKAFFYQQRDEYNKNRKKINYVHYTETWFRLAAQLIFLNRTCFNGLHRVNSKGDFNTPMGDYINPNICDEHNLMAVNNVLQIAEIKKADFNEVLHDAQRDAFVYFDPPYRPISKTASFKAYSNASFGDEQQTVLAELFKKLDKKGMLLMLSNSDPKNIQPDDTFFDDLYKDYHIQRLPARRMINSDASKRGLINEIVVMNY